MDIENDLKVATHYSLLQLMSVVHPLDGLNGVWLIRSPEIDSIEYTDTNCIRGTSDNNPSDW